MFRAILSATVLLALASTGCEKPKNYTTNMQVLQIQRFRADASIMDVQLRYSDCPGDARRLVRLDKATRDCAKDFKTGDILPTEIRSTWSSERGSYQNDIIKLGPCAVNLDPKEEANYEVVQSCSELKASGATVGVHCDRGRTPEMIAKCPFLRKK